MSNHTFKPGQTSIPAVWLNDVNKAVNAPGGMLNGKRTLTPDGIIIVRNDSGANLGIDGVLGISGSVIDPADNPAEFAARPVFIGITPTADHVGKFVVLREPIANGCYGEAWVSGHFATQINVVSEADTTADASVDGNATMYSTTGGVAQILWKESGTGVKRAVVRLGGGGGAVTGSARFRVECEVVAVESYPETNLSYFNLTLSGDDASEIEYIGTEDDALSPAISIANIDSMPVLQINTATPPISLPVSDATYAYQAARITVTALNDAGERDYSYRPEFGKQVTLTFAESKNDGRPSRISLLSLPRNATANASNLFGRFKYGDSSNKVLWPSNWTFNGDSVTGVSESNSHTVDGCYVLFIKRVSDVVYFYKSPLMDANNLVAHSGTPSTVGGVVVIDIIADNGSGIGGELQYPTSRNTDDVDMVVLAFVIVPNGDYSLEDISGLQSPETMGSNEYPTTDAFYSTPTKSLGMYPSILQDAFDLRESAGLSTAIVPVQTTPDYDGTWYRGQWSSYITVDAKTDLWYQDITTKKLIPKDDLTLLSNYYFVPGVSNIDRSHIFNGLLIEATDRWPLYYDTGRWYRYASEEDFPVDPLSDPTILTSGIGCANVEDDAGYGYAMVNVKHYSPQAWYLQLTYNNEWVGVDWFDMNHPFILPKTGQYEWASIIDDDDYYRVVAIMYGHHPSCMNMSYFPQDIVAGNSYPYVHIPNDISTTPIYPKLWVLEYNKDTGARKYYIETELGTFTSGITARDMTRCHMAYPYTARWDAWYDCVNSEWKNVLSLTEYDEDVDDTGGSWVENPNHTFYYIGTKNDLTRPELPTQPTCTYLYWCTYDCSSSSWGDVMYYDDVDSRRDTIDWTDYDGTGLYYTITDSATPPSAPSFTPSPIYYYWYAQYYCGFGWMMMPSGCALTGTVSDWALQYQDECSAYYSRVTTSSSEPTAPSDPDCSGCEY